MPSSYPSAIDSFPTLVDNVDTIHASEWNNLGDSLVAIEQAVGANLSVLQSIGEIKLWSGSIETIPAGWLVCDGGAVSRNTYSSLFGVIGTAYGVGDGSSTFNLPDFNDAFLVGVKLESSGVTYTNLEGSLTKTGGSQTQPPTTGTAVATGKIEGGPNQKLGSHDHTFTPPFVAMVYIIKA